jgi:two-component sensor histidine kinase
MLTRSSNRAQDTEHVAGIDSTDEANHRIANSLTIIAGAVRSELSTLMHRPDPESVRRSLELLSVRIDAVARLHRLLMTSGIDGVVELRAYLHDIIDAATCSLADVATTQVMFISETTDTVSVHEAIAIAAFIVEAIINSIKHSKAPQERTTIKITCRRLDAGTRLIEVQDDNAGTIPDFGAKSERSAGMGIRLMRNLATSLNANLQLINNNSGHIVRLVLPLSRGTEHNENPLENLTRTSKECEAYALIVKGEIDYAETRS